jgi:serine/threonine protein kinase
MIYNFDTWPPSMIIFNCQVDWTQPIGTGGTANVFKARWDNEAVVVKRFNVKLTPEQKKARCSPTACYSTADFPTQLFVREVVTWKQLRSPYILKLYGLYDSKASLSMRYVLVSPRMPHTLTSFVCPGRNILSATTPGGYCPAKDRLRLVSPEFHGS